MDFGALIPIAGIVGGTWTFVAILRFARDRQALQAAAAGAGDKAELAQENAALRLTVKRMEERLAVLERLATDPAEWTAREIESLR